MGVTLVADKTRVAPGETVTFTVSAAVEYPDQYLYVIIIYFGDGDLWYRQFTEPIDRFDAMVQHSYAAEGYYTAYAEAIVFDPEMRHYFYFSSDLIYILVVAPVPTPPPPVLPPQPPPIPIEPERPPTEEPVLPRPPDLKPEEPPWRDTPPEPYQPPDRPPPPRLTNDYIVWNAFISRYGDRIQRWALEVPLDWGDRLPNSVPEQYRALWARLTAHKADAFIDFGRVIYVAEIKPRLTLACLGQAFFGYQLAIKRYRFDKPVKPACIVATAPHTLLPIAAQNGIVVFVLQEITGEPLEGGE